MRIPPFDLLWPNRFCVMPIAAAVLGAGWLQKK
jgi:hypothetical protein